MDSKTRVQLLILLAVLIIGGSCKPEPKKTYTGLPGLDGSYSDTSLPGVKFILKDGEYKLGGEDIFDSGNYEATRIAENEFEIQLISFDTPELSMEYKVKFKFDGEKWQYREAYPGKSIGSTRTFVKD